jgi:hypothetical protein
MAKMCRQKISFNRKITTCFEQMENRHSGPGVEDACLAGEVEPHLDVAAEALKNLEVMEGPIGKEIRRAVEPNMVQQVIGAPNA